MKKMQNQDGFVALFTCIMVSLLLVIITVGMVTIEALQLRKSEDSEQSLRAYYTAEAGIEDAVSQILSGTIAPGVGDNTCNSSANYDPLGGAVASADWTCQDVSFSGAPEGLLKIPDQAVTVDPGNVVPGYSSVLLEWDQSADPNPAHFTVNLAAGLPDQPTYVANYAAAPIELAIVQYPNGPFAAGNPQLTLENALIVPDVGAGFGNVNYAAANFTTNWPFSGNCSPNRTVGYGGNPTNYNCYAIMTGLSPGKNYLFRLRSRYLPSSYKMTFFAPSGAIESVADGTATIDVTAKAGSTYRRVLAKLPLTKGAAASLNYVMYSDNDICKDFDVINNVPKLPYPC
jgi:hypothetical protein